ncbi:hypothetical protein DLJ49_12525 [Rhodovulum sp. 12E13]|uniref:DUF5333 domain-containing protein n=1 Tax=Rhodovulum sp. 12E13 TaxID=2203891 RepID=UPI000E17904B|nr:DUF5333 domain-containing protein [Rhodovulum sp. 12E13]RDC71915.1 hypothetical protein DLJ49_12525 [Rhodovulum sp. 12E13]
MRHLIATALGIVLFALALGGAAGALPPLAQNKPINDQLFAAAVGDRIRKECPEISARLWVVMRKAQALERYALDQGYTQAQIDAYTASDPDKKRLEARALAYLAERSARPGDAEAHCRVGRAEIAAKSPIGELLRSR